MNFKEQLNEDLDLLFDIDVFGEKAIINGAEATVIVDDEALEKRKTNMSNRMTEGLSKDALLFYIEASFFKEGIPKPGKRMKFNKVDYEIIDSKEEMGMLTIILERYTD